MKTLFFFLSLLSSVAFSGSNKRPELYVEPAPQVQDVQVLDNYSNQIIDEQILDEMQEASSIQLRSLWKQFLLTSQVRSVPQTNFPADPSKDAVGDLLTDELTRRANKYVETQQAQILLLDIKKKSPLRHLAGDRIIEQINLDAIAYFLKISFQNPDEACPALENALHAAFLLAEQIEPQSENPISRDLLLLHTVLGLAYTKLHPCRQITALELGLPYFAPYPHGNLGRIVRLDERFISQKFYALRSENDKDMMLFSFDMSKPYVELFFSKFHKEPRYAPIVHHNSMQVIEDWGSR